MGSDLLDRSRQRPAVPESIRWVAVARATRWFGWGFGETLLPVFIATFSTSLFEAGAISSAYDFVFLASLPFVAGMADARSSRRLIFLGLLLYPFIGAFYFMAGLLALPLFIVVARALNGVAYSLDTVGIGTYVRRMAPAGGIARAFGYMDSLSNLTWLIAALIGVGLVQFVKLYTLLFLITPFSFLALFPLWMARKDRPERRAESTANSWTQLLKGWRSSKKDLRRVLILMLLLETASVACTFFVPIAAYRSGADLPEVALLCLLSSVPSLFEYWASTFIDGPPEKRWRALIISISVLPPLFLVVAFVPSIFARMAVAFAIGTAAAIGALALQAQATLLSRRDSFGQVSALMEGSLSVSDLASPILLGAAADLLGINYMFVLCSLGFLAMALAMIWIPRASLGEEIPNA